MINTTNDLKKAYSQTTFAEDDRPPTWDGMDIEDDHIYAPQGSTLGLTLISLDDVYEGHGEDCLFIQELFEIGQRRPTSS